MTKYSSPAPAWKGVSGGSGVTVPAPPAVETPVTDAPDAGARPPVLTARGSGAATGDGLRASLRLRNPSVRPLRTFWHAGLFAFELVTPANIDNYLSKN